MSSGPLNDITVVEFAGLGPAPYAAMLLADMGATVIRIERPDAPPASATAISQRGRAQRYAADLKNPDDLAGVRQLLRNADALIEGFRPGTMERLGLGPDVVLQENPRLVYGRVTGWGQTGPLKLTAGHDVNFIAVTGALAAIGGLAPGMAIRSRGRGIRPAWRVSHERPGFFSARGQDITRRYRRLHRRGGRCRRRSIGHRQRGGAARREIGRASCRERV